MTDATESEKLRELESIARGNGYWNHIEPFVEALTRERDEAVKRRREIDDEAFDYAEQIETLKTKLAAARVCQWREDDSDFDTWKTGCGHLWQFNTGGPKENGTKFCQYCGGFLTAALTQGDA